MTAMRTAITVMTVVPFSMLMIVMVAGGIRIICKITGKIILYRLIRIPLNSRQKLYPDFLQGISRAHTDTSADQYLHFRSAKESRKSSVTCSVGVDDLRSPDLSIGYVIYLKLLSSSEVLSYHFLFISNCDSHDIFSLFIDLDRSRDGINPV